MRQMVGFERPLKVKLVTALLLRLFAVEEELLELRVTSSSNTSVSPSGSGSYAPCMFPAVDGLKKKSFQIENLENIFQIMAKDLHYIHK